MINKVKNGLTICVQYVIYYIKFDIFVETKEGGLGRNCRIDLLKFILCL